MIYLSLTFIFISVTAITFYALYSIIRKSDPTIKKLKDVGLVAPLGGSIQIILLFSFGFIVASFLQFKLIESIYVGMIIAFSSTMIVLKLISDKRQLDTLHGRIIVGILLTEDFFAIMAISILPTLAFINFAFGKLVLSHFLV